MNSIPYQKPIDFLTFTETVSLVVVLYSEDIVRDIHQKMIKHSRSEISENEFLIYITVNLALQKKPFSMAQVVGAKSETTDGSNEYRRVFVAFIQNELHIESTSEIARLTGLPYSSVYDIGKDIKVRQKSQKKYFAQFHTDLAELSQIYREMKSIFSNVPQKK